MNISWCLEWQAIIEEVYNLYNVYQGIIQPDFFNPDNPTTEAALMWLSRDVYLNTCVDLIRDLYWHNLFNRYRQITINN